MKDAALIVQALHDSKSQNSPHSEAGDTSSHTHPCLILDNDPAKGRLLRLSSAVPSGTVLLVDVSYATVPTFKSSSKAALICSNLQCSQRVTRNRQTVRCPECRCSDVAWCNTTCRSTDIARHAIECKWLRQLSETIRQNEGEYNFLTLWHVVRLMAGRTLEIVSDVMDVPERSFSRRDWKAVEECCSYLDSWPEPQIKHWKRLIESYLRDAFVHRGSLNEQEMLSLICKEETNTFGLYENVTGPLHMIDRLVPRGESYGMSLYPRAARFNHSCMPNVSHKPDSRGRMVFTAARDIAKDEECNITYFDLTAFEGLSARQKWVQEQFRFTCTCERCIEEAAAENLDVMDSLPFSDC